MTSTILPLLLTAALSSITGCVSWAEGPNGISEGTHGMLTKKTAKETGCSEDEIQSRPIGPIPGSTTPAWFIHEFSGCDQKRQYYTSCPNESWCTVWVVPVNERASFDLECPSESLKVQSLGGDTFGVTGCDKRATYVFTNGGWLLNSDERSDDK